MEAIGWEIVEDRYLFMIKILHQCVATVREVTPVSDTASAVQFWIMEVVNAH